MRVSSFGDAATAMSFAGFVNGRVKADVGHKLFGVREARDIADFSDDNSGGEFSQAWDAEKNFPG